MSRVPEGAGRYDHLHGDEPFIEAEERSREQAREDYRAEHWDEGEYEPYTFPEDFEEPDDLDDLDAPERCPICGLLPQGEHFHDPT